MLTHISYKITKSIHSVVEYGILSYTNDHNNQDIEAEQICEMAYVKIDI
jgi:hypothetical protein